MQRPTAKELLKHKFITRYTKKTSYLTELIDRYRRWKSEGHGDESSSDDSDMYVIHPLWDTYCTINNRPLIHLYKLFISYYLSPVLLIRYLLNWSSWFIALKGTKISVPRCTQTGMEIVMTETSVPCGRSPQSGPAPWTSSRRATQTQTQRSVLNNYIMFDLKTKPYWLGLCPVIVNHKKGEKMSF